MPAILKNIRFKQAQAQVLSIRPSPRILLEWELEKTTQAASRLKFFIYRGESPNDLKVIAGPVAHNALLEFVDYTVKMGDQHKTYSYQIWAVEYEGSAQVQTFKSEVFSWDSQLDLTGIYMVEETEWANEHVLGVPCMIFKRMREGIHCTECWDTVLKRVTKSNCITCKGTGWVGGFYDPLEKWLEIQQIGVNPQISDLGDKQNRRSQARLANYPIIRDGDIIVELEPDRYWKVSGVDTSEKNKSPVLQVLLISEVERSDIEYHIEVETTTRRRLVDQLRARRTKPEF